MRRQIRAAQPCLLNLRQSCRSCWQRRQHRLFVAASHSIEIFTRSSSSLRRAMPHNLTAGGCMAEVAMTTLTWTFVGGGELISYYIYWYYTYYIFIKLIFFLLADDYAGVVWGAFTPYPIAVGKSVIFPVPPFASLTSIGYYAGLFGSMAMINRLSSEGMALARNRRDTISDVIGGLSVFGYTKYLIESEKRMMWNNRAFAGLAFGSILYANTAP